MRHAKLVRAATYLCLLVGLAGCSTPSSQLSTCQAEKEQLLTTIRSQRDTTRALHAQVASLESRLDQSEKELARAGGTTRLSSRPSDTPPIVRSDSLSWRSPASMVSTPAAPSSRGASRAVPGGTSLLELARRDRRLQYDAAAHAAKFDLSIAFEDHTATLTAQGKQQLDELARLLKSDDASELRVMVAGFAAGRPSTTEPHKEGEARFASARQLGTARAQAVADYLDRHGIAQERLGISGTGARLPQGRPDTEKIAASGVQVYLLEADTPVVGWGPTNQPLRR